MAEVLRALRPRGDRARPARDGPDHARLDRGVRARPGAPRRLSGRPPAAPHGTSVRSLSAPSVLASAAPWPDTALRGSRPRSCAAALVACAILAAACGRAAGRAVAHARADAARDARPAPRRPGIGPGRLQRPRPRGPAKSRRTRPTPAPTGAASSPGSTPRTAAGRSRSSQFRTLGRPRQGRQLGGRRERPARASRRSPSPATTSSSRWGPFGLGCQARRSPTSARRPRSKPWSRALDRLLSPLRDAHDRARADRRRRRGQPGPVRPPHRRRHPRPEAVPFGR